VRRFRRFMYTPLGIVLVFVAIPLWTWYMLGWDAGWRMALLMGALGATDLAIGWGPGRTLSEQVNEDWHRSPKRYVFWIIGLAVGMLLLHLHFTGV